MRWVCPLCDRAALAPERPRKNDVRRYCLTCSKKTGRLVERVAPVLAKRREQASALRADKTTRERERETAAWTVAGEDLRKLAAKCWTALGAVIAESDTLRGRLAFSFRLDTWAARIPSIRLRRRGNGRGGSSGYARRFANRITLVIGHDCDRAKILELMVHEMAHCARFKLSTLLRSDGPHGTTFNLLMTRAAAKLWDVHVSPGPRGYWASHMLVKKLREQLMTEAVHGGPTAALQVIERVMTEVESGT